MPSFCWGELQRFSQRRLATIRRRIWAAVALVRGCRAAIEQHGESAPLRVLDFPAHPGEFADREAGRELQRDAEDSDTQRSEAREFSSPEGADPPPSSTFPTASTQNDSHASGPTAGTCKTMREPSQAQVAARTPPQRAPATQQGTKAKIEMT